MIGVDEFLEQARLDALAGVRNVDAAFRLAPDSHLRKLARPMTLFAQTVGALEVAADELARPGAEAA